MSIVERPTEDEALRNIEYEKYVLNLLSISQFNEQDIMYCLADRQYEGNTWQVAELYGISLHDLDKRLELVTHALNIYDTKTGGN